jgi:DNA polymerase-3 subunit delta'
MSFQHITGQNKAIEILKGYIVHSTLEGSYLFIGPEGIGKKLVTKTLAKALNCINRIEARNIDSCDRCVSCLKIDKNGHPDIHIIEAEDKEIKIDSIRQMQRDISLRPYEARLKVFIIDNAHKLNSEAANCLLKILEEPPKDSLIILLSDKPKLLFQTIISRCKIVQFCSIKRQELKDILIKDYKLDVNNAHFLSYFSEGRLGLALRLKDKDFLREKNIIINQFILRKPILNALSKENREDIRGYLNILAGWFRDIYLVKIGVPHSEIINFDRRDELLKQTGRFSFLSLDEIMNSISDSLFYLEQNINVKLLLYELGAKLWKA